jgi:hypothetical protein
MFRNGSLVLACFLFTLAQDLTLLAAGQANHFFILVWDSTHSDNSELSGVRYLEDGNGQWGAGFAAPPVSTNGALSARPGLKIQTQN